MSNRANTDIDHLVSSACQRHGLQIRKHLADVHSWPYRIPTVTNLEAREYALLHEQGEVALQRDLEQRGEFLFPAADIRRPRKLLRETPVVGDGQAQLAVIVREDESVLWRIAQAFAQHVQRQTGVSIPVLPDDEPGLLQQRQLHLLVLGGSHQNKVAGQLAYRYLWPADEFLPGAGGLLAQTLHGLLCPERNILLLAADRHTEKQAIGLLRNGFGRLGNDAWGLQRLFAAAPGAVFKPLWARRQQVLATIVRASIYSGGPAETGDPAPGDWGAAAETIVRQYDAGGPESNRYNVMPLVAGMLAFHAYQMTGDQHYLLLYKKILWGSIEYHLLSPGGASYLSDYDFYLGGLIISWSMAESEPIFDDDERLIVANFLLAACRQVARYKEAFWKTPPGKLRFNHQTFPALSLMAGAAYFESCYGITEATQWNATARQCFSGPTGKVVKHLENAGLYQWIVPLHKFAYDSFTGGMEVAKNGVLLATARRILPSLDNFGYLVEGGDNPMPLNSGLYTGVLAGGSEAPAMHLLRAAAALGNDGELAWAWHRLRQTAAPTPFAGFPLFGLSHSAGAAMPPAAHPRATTGWERLPMEEQIRKRVRPAMARKWVADKIAFRQGWDADDQYLLFSPYSCDHHIHYDMNSILRYNHLGRVWLVDNGYGKPVSTANVANVYAMRQRGPEDHNTLVFRGADGLPVIPPPFCGITHLGSPGKGYFALQSVLCGIDGSDWRRTVLIGQGTFLLVVDEVTCGGRQSAIECQWAALGKATLKQDIWMLRQNGVQLFVQFAAQDSSESGEYLSEEWRETFESGAYPYAKAPVRKLIQTARQPSAGDRLVFVNLLAASTDTKSPYRFAWDGETLQISGELAPVAQSTVGNVTMNGVSNALTCHFPKTWKLPQGLTREMFGSFGPCN